MSAGQSTRSTYWTRPLTSHPSSWAYSRSIRRWAGDARLIYPTFTILWSRRTSSSSFRTTQTRRIRRTTIDGYSFSVYAGNTLTNWTMYRFSRIKKSHSSSTGRHPMVRYGGLYDYTSTNGNPSYLCDATSRRESSRSTRASTRTRTIGIFF